MPGSWPMASPGSMASWWPAMTPPRATSVPRTRMTYSCESSADVVADADRRDDHAELGGDLAADRADARRAACRRACWSTSGTRPKPIASSSGSSASASSAASRGAGSCAGSARRRPRPSAASSRSAWFGSLAQRPADGEEAAPPMTRNGIFGRPGTSAKAQITHAGDQRRLALARGSGPRCRCRGRCSEAERVTRMPVATEISSAGICAHRPSPMVSSEKCWPASPNGMPCCTTPMTMPPIRLMPVIRMPAIASPLTNFEAPSIAP